MLKDLPFPDPASLWGDHSIDGWPSKQQGMFSLWLVGIASAIIFAEQDTIDRVDKYIKNVIYQAKAGVISAEEAVEMVKPSNVFINGEINQIKKNASRHGKMMANFYKVKNRLPN